MMSAFIMLHPLLFLFVKYRMFFSKHGKINAMRTFSIVPSNEYFRCCFLTYESDLQNTCLCVYVRYMLHFTAW